jgi:hypothetical protein
MVMPIKDKKLDGAPGAGTVGGLRPTAVPAPAAPELSDRPRRRTFTVGDKLRVLAEIDRAPAGGTGAILRLDRATGRASRRYCPPCGRDRRSPGITAVTRGSPLP